LFIAIPIHAQSEYIYILGNTQDAGMPHIGCKHKFCLDNFNKYEEFYVTSIAVVNSDLKKYILFEATPDITFQLNYVKKNIFQEFLLPEAIYITHAHIGHYTGLMYFGREALGSKNLLVKVLPKMSNFLKTNGPWSQLVTLNNIQIQNVEFDGEINYPDSFNIKDYAMDLQFFSMAKAMNLQSPTFNKEIDKENNIKIENAILNKAKKLKLQSS